MNLFQALTDAMDIVLSSDETASMLLYEIIRHFSSITKPSISFFSQIILANVLKSQLHLSTTLTIMHLTLIEIHFN